MRPDLPSSRAPGVFVSGDTNFLPAGTEAVGSRRGLNSIHLGPQTSILLYTTTRANGSRSSQAFWQEPCNDPTLDPRGEAPRAHGGDPAQHGRSRPRRRHRRGPSPGSHVAAPPHVFGHAPPRRRRYHRAATPRALNAMLAVDATVAFDAAFDTVVFDRIAPTDPVGPPLLWSETTATLRQAAFRGSVTGDERCGRSLVAGRW